EMASRAAADAQRTVQNVGNFFYWKHDVDTLVHRILFRRWQALGNRADLETVERWAFQSGVVERVASWKARKYGGFDCDASLLLVSRLMIEKERYGEAAELLDEVWPHALGTRRVHAQ